MFHDARLGCRMTERPLCRVHHVMVRYYQASTNVIPVPHNWCMPVSALIHPPLPPSTSTDSCRLKTVSIINAPTTNELLCHQNVSRNLSEKRGQLKSAVKWGGKASSWGWINSLQKSLWEEERLGSTSEGASDSDPLVIALTY